MSIRGGAAIGAAVAFLTVAAPANATTFCVPGFHDGCPDDGTNVAQPSLATALSSEGADGVADKVIIDAGTYTAPGTWQLTGSDALEIQGAGRTQTTLTSESDQNIHVVDLSTGNTRDITMRDLRVLVPASFPDGLGAALQMRADSLERVDFKTDNPNSVAVNAMVDGGSLQDVRILGGASRFRIGVRAQFQGWATIDGLEAVAEDYALQISGNGNVHVQAENMVLRGTKVAAVHAYGGDTNLTNSVIMAEEGFAIAVAVNTADNAFLAGNFLSMSVSQAGLAAAVVSQVSSGNGTASLTLANSVAHGYMWGYQRSAPPGSPSGDAYLTLMYSSLPLGTSSGDGTMVLGAGYDNNDPMFRDAEGGDLRLAKGSPAIDSADPSSFVLRDIEGNQRPQDGDGVDGARSDRGAFEFDAKPPQTKIVKGPGPKGKKGKPVFRFTADEQGVRFECSIDRKAFKSCKSPKRYKGLKPGRHRFRVRAIDSYDNVDPSPAKKRFRVKKRKRR